MQSSKAANFSPDTAGTYWRSLFIFLFVYRCSMSVIGELFIARLTQLGDSESYQHSIFTITDVILDIRGDEIFTVGRYYSTKITESVGALFHLLFFGNYILIDIGFQTIAFIGIYKFLTSLDQRSRLFLFLLVLTPSFNIWSSIASKEPLVVFFVGVLCANIVNCVEGRFRIGPLEVICFVGVFMFKVQYIPAIVAVYGFIIVGRYVRRKALFALFAGLFSIIPLYLGKDKIDNMAFGILPHFVGLGSSREAYWVETYDVFYKAPFGMFQAFFGPTLAESSKGFLQMASFIESSFIVFVLLYFVIGRFARLPVYCFFAGSFSLAWLLFATYPLGILNAGAAVRYRTGHFLLVFLIFAVIFSRAYFVRWSRNGETEKSSPAAVR